METRYRRAFLKDLKKLKGQTIYDRIFEFTFTTLPEIYALQELTNVKAMKGYPNRYRVRFGDYRVGLEVNGNEIEVMRVLHRREFSRYFP